MAKVAPLIGHANSGEAASIACDVILSIDMDHASWCIFVYTWSEAVWTEVLSTLENYCSYMLQFEKSWWTFDFLNGSLNSPTIS